MIPRTLLVLLSEILLQTGVEIFLILKPSVA